MTATQAVLAVALAAVATVVILAVPAVRRRRARHRRAVQAFAWFQPARQPAGYCSLEELLDPSAPVPDLSTPDVVEPLRAALEQAAPPVNPLDVLVRRADEELAANERFRAWLAGTVPTHLGGER